VESGEIVKEEVIDTNALEERMPELVTARSLAFSGFSHYFVSDSCCRIDKAKELISLGICLIRNCFGSCFEIVECKKF